MQKRFPLSSVDAETHEMLVKLIALVSEEKEMPVSIPQLIKIMAKEKLARMEPDA